MVFFLTKILTKKFKSQKTEKYGFYENSMKGERDHMTLVPRNQEHLLFLKGSCLCI